MPVGRAVPRLPVGLESSFFCPYFLGPGQVYFAFLSVLDILIWFELQQSGSALWIMSDITRLALSKTFTKSSQFEKHCLVGGQ